MSDSQKRKLNEIHDYWKNHSKPETYITPERRSAFLAKHVNNYIQKDERILEIGCNVGRNLNYLYQEGYEYLTGIEISKEAIELLEQTYPLLAQHAEIFCSPIEDLIRTIPENHYDLVFTMAVMEHIHPDSEWIFEDVARITGMYLLTIEAEKAKNWRLFPRNYQKVFEQYGLKQIVESDCEEAGLGLYTLRIFKK